MGFCCSPPSNGQLGCGFMKPYSLAVLHNRIVSNLLLIKLKQKFENFFLRRPFANIVFSLNKHQEKTFLGKKLVKWFCFEWTSAAGSSAFHMSLCLEKSFRIFCEFMFLFSSLTKVKLLLFSWSVEYHFFYQKEIFFMIIQEKDPKLSKL